MKASELRIGNLVSNGINHYTVDINMLYDLATSEHYPIEPILLTPDLLEQYGFKMCSCGGFKNDGLHIGKDDLGRLYYKGVTLEYLHQLQNLYYCLAGEELKTKP